MGKRDWKQSSFRERLKMKSRRKNKKIVFDALQIAQVEALAPYLTIEGITKHFDLCEETFRNIRKRQPEVLGAYNKGRIKAYIFAGQTVMGFLKEKQNTPTKLAATQFFLTHQAGWVKAEFVPPKEEPQELKLTINVLQPKEIDR